VFNATNDTISIRVGDEVKDAKEGEGKGKGGKGWASTKEFLEEQCPGVKFWRDMGRNEAPLSNRKIREVLGFKDVHDWKNYV